MTVYNPSGDALYIAPITKDAIIRNVLMEEYYIELSFDVIDVVAFGRGCYIMHNGRKFEIMSTVHAEPLSSGNGYHYTLRFESQQSQMKRCKVFWRGGTNLETTFHNTTNIASFGALIAENVNAFLGTTNWSVGGVPADIAEQTKLISFNGDTCWDAINLIAQTFDVEWWTVENGDKVSIYFGKLELGTAEEFVVGDVISNIPTRNGDDSEYGTRFYVFGSTRNLPSDYNDTEQGGVSNHVSEVRLHLPNGQRYIDAWDNLQPEDVVEQVVFFDDVYPKNTETVTTVSTVDREIVEGQTDKAYVMECADTPFTSDDIIEGETLGCTFTSGSLMGRSFELSINESSFDKKFEIVAQTEGSGDNIIIIPNDSIRPIAGDTFILTGVQLPQARISEAEQELLSVGTSWAVKKSRDTAIYDCPTNPVYCNEHDKNYELGQRVILRGAQFGDGRESRIQGYEKKLWDEYQATYTVGDNTAYSRFGTIEKNIEATAYAERIGVVQGVGIYVIRSKYDSTSATDENVYSALATEALFLSKKAGGTVNGPVTFNKDVTLGGDIKTADFEPEALTGRGFGVTRDENGNAIITTDILKVRMTAEFNELVINQTSFHRGTTVYSAAGCEITAVEEVDGIYRCYYDNEEGRRYSGFVAGDQARCQRYDADYGSIIRYYWRVVKAVGEDYVDLYIAGKDSNGNALAMGLDAPEVGDHLVQFGHRYDPKRQGAIVISSTPDPMILQYDGIYSFTLPAPTTKISPGDNYLSGMLRILPGSTGLSDMDEYKELQKEVSSVAISVEDTNERIDEFGTIVDDVKAQADKEYTIWFFDAIPTLTNMPAVEWFNDELLALHDQDLYYSKPLGRAWRFVDGDWDEITDADTIAALRESNSATQRVNELEDIIDAYGADLEIVKNQLDKEFTIWFAEDTMSETYVPTNDNYPASDWTTESLKVLHDQDLFYNRKSGRAWRYEEQAWVEITDADTVAALNKASVAQDTADNKRRVFTAQPTTEEAYDEGDLWVNATYDTIYNNDLLRCKIPKLSGQAFDITHWELSAKYTDDARAEEAYSLAEESQNYINNVLPGKLEELQNQLDGKVESFFYDYDPTTSNIPASDWTTDELKEAHLNDTFTNTESGLSWRWLYKDGSYQWVQITDSQAAEALVLAQQAKDTADGKRRVFVTTPYVPYDQGDLWVQGTSGDIMRCQTAQTKDGSYSASHWVKASKYTDDTMANEAYKEAGNALAAAEAAANGLAEVQYLKEALKNDATMNATITNAMVLGTLLGVWNKNGQVVSCLNGSDLGKHSECGKLMLAAGIPMISNKTFAERAAEAAIRLYEDGTLIANQGVFSGQVLLGDGKITLNQDGSGHLADGSVKWNTDGVVTYVYPNAIQWTSFSTAASTNTLDLTAGGYISEVSGRTCTIPNPAVDGLTLVLRGPEATTRSTGVATFYCASGTKFKAATANYNSSYPSSTENTADVFVFAYFGSKTGEATLRYSATDSTWAIETDGKLIIDAGAIKVFPDDNTVGGDIVPLKKVTTNTTITANDYMIVASASSAITLTLPTDIATGRRYEVFNSNGKSITFNGGTKTIYRSNGTTGTSHAIAAGYFHAILTYDGSYWLLSITENS